MKYQNHQDYYVARAAKSRDQAERAADPAVAAIHNELAKRYETLAVHFHQQTDGTTPIFQLI